MVRPEVVTADTPEELAAADKLIGNVLAEEYAKLDALNHLIRRLTARRRLVRVRLAAQEQE